MTSRRFLVWLAVAACSVCALWFLVGRSLTIEEIKQISETAQGMSARNPVWAFISLAFAQAVGMGLGLPTKALLTLLAGALLGIAMGAVATLVGVLSGAAALFLAVRYFLKKSVSRHFGENVRKIEKRVSERPIRTMIGLRLFIALPYGPCTITAALSSMSLRDFLVGSAIGDIPVIALYSAAGQKLFSLASASEAISASTAGLLAGAGALLILSVAAKAKPRRADDTTRL